MLLLPLSTGPYDQQLIAVPSVNIAVVAIVNVDIVFECCCCCHLLSFVVINVKSKKVEYVNRDGRQERDHSWVGQRWQWQQHENEKKFKNHCSADDLQGLSGRRLNEMYEDVLRENNK